MTVAEAYRLALRDNAARSYACPTPSTHDVLKRLRDAGEALTRAELLARYGDVLRFADVGEAPARTTRSVVLAFRPR